MRFFSFSPFSPLIVISPREQTGNLKREHSSKVAEEEKNERANLLLHSCAILFYTLGVIIPPYSFIREIKLSARAEVVAPPHASRIIIFISCRFSRTLSAVVIRRVETISDSRESVFSRFRTATRPPSARSKRDSQRKHS